MNDEIAKAQILFKDVVIDERLRFDSEFGAKLFETAIFCYVPFMVQMHREVWTEEQLLVFYFSNDEASEVCRRKGKRGKLIFQSIKSIDEIPVIFELYANVIDRSLPLPISLLPDCYFIEGKHFKRVLDLLVFS